MSLRLGASQQYGAAGICQRRSVASSSSIIELMQKFAYSSVLSSMPNMVLSRIDEFSNLLVIIVYFAVIYKYRPVEKIVKKIVKNDIIRTLMSNV